jgi:hypothetical protein
MRFACRLWPEVGFADVRNKEINQWLQANWEPMCGRCRLRMLENRVGCSEMEL